MKCPHCNHGIHWYRNEKEIGHDIEGYWVTSYMICPECHRLMIALERWSKLQHHPSMTFTKHEMQSSYFVRPLGVQRPKAPPEVPINIAADYNEACFVLPFSAKASAALSRRCLQHFLREVAKIKPDDLSKEIDAAMSHLPSHLSESIDAIRNIGNFSTHPIKSKNTGEIVDVEPGEAEWNLDVLEELFDHYCVKPERIKKKRDILNSKLHDAGKPKLKGSESQTTKGASNKKG